MKNDYFYLPNWRNLKIQKRSVLVMMQEQKCHVVGSLKDGCHDSHLLVVSPCVIPILKCGLDLITRFLQIEYRKSVSFPRLTVPSIHIVCSLSICPLFTQREVSCHVVSCPKERPVWQETDTSGQKPAKTWGVPIATWVTLRGSTPSFEPWDKSSSDQHLDCSPMRDANPVKPDKPCWDIRPSEIGR